MSRIITMLLLAVVMAAGVAYGDVVGKYSGGGSNPGGGGNYNCDVVIAKNGENYLVQWYINGALAYDGVGIMKNGLLCVGYASGGGYGVVVYEVAADGTLNGVWTTPGFTALGSETLKKK